MSDSTVRLGPDGGTLLGVAFVILKLTGVIGWSWWWVLAPFWVPGALTLAIFTIVGIVTMGFKR